MPRGVGTARKRLCMSQPQEVGRLGALYASMTQRRMFASPSMLSLSSERADDVDSHTTHPYTVLRRAPLRYIGGSVDYSWTTQKPVGWTWLWAL